MKQSIHPDYSQITVSWDRNKRYESGIRWIAIIYHMNPLLDLVNKKVLAFRVKLSRSLHLMWLLRFYRSTDICQRTGKRCLSTCYAGFFTFIVTRP